MKDSKTIYIIIIAALCLILFCSILVIFGVLSLNALPMTFLGAAMGAVITGVITLTLLQGQQTAQEVKERNVMIFKKKSKIIKKFINMVWKIWTKEEITIERYKKITSFYYKNLMIYMTDTKKEDTPVKKIGTAITNLGQYLGKETPNYLDKLQEYVFDIINALSKELDLGGEIKNMDIIKEHGNKLFPLLFRKKILDSFNDELDLKNSTTFKQGQWKKWHEGNIMHDDIVFTFKDFPQCSIRVGIAKNVSGSDFTDYIVFIFFVPCGAEYHRFNEFRKVKKGLEENRILLASKQPQKIFGKPSQDDLDIPYFNFYDGKYIENIRNSGNYKQIAEAFAQRTSAVFKELKIKDKDKSKDLDMSFVEFLKEYYGKR